jgi:hypothetical protein
MRCPSSLLLSAFLAFAALSAGSLAGPAPSSAATTIAATTLCGNSVDNTPGLGAICEVTVVNSITPFGGSAFVSVRECHGPSGDPTASCSIATLFLAEPVTAVSQCNSSMEGGGATLRCSVTIRNDFVGIDPGAIAATVNQCVGSGDGLTIGCVPFPATTTSATITQCNGSANGGNLVGLICSASGTSAAALGVSVNQCNGSANGGGSLVICSATISSRLVINPPVPTAGPTTGPAPAPSGTPAATPTPSATPAATPAPGSASATPIASPTLPTDVAGPEGGITSPVPTLPNTNSVDRPAAPVTVDPVPVLAVLLILVFLALFAASQRAHRRSR